MSEIDYTKYNLADLHDALANINAEKYPENYARLQAELAKPERQAKVRKNEAAIMVTATEAGPSNLQTVVRVILVIFAIVGFLVTLNVLNNGEITSKRGSVIVTLADNPLGFYFGIACYIGGSLYLLYIGITGKYLKKM